MFFYSSVITWHFGNAVFCVFFVNLHSIKGLLVLVRGLKQGFFGPVFGGAKCALLGTPKNPVAIMTWCFAWWFLHRWRRECTQMYTQFCRNPVIFPRNAQNCTPRSHGNPNFRRFLGVFGQYELIFPDFGRFEVKSVFLVKKVSKKWSFWWKTSKNPCFWPNTEYAFFEDSCTKTWKKSWKTGFFWVKWAPDGISAKTPKNTPKIDQNSGFFALSAVFGGCKKAIFRFFDVFLQNSFFRKMAKKVDFWPKRAGVLKNVKKLKKKVTQKTTKTEFSENGVFLVHRKHHFFAKFENTCFELPHQS